MANNNLYLRIKGILAPDDVVLDIGCGDKTYSTKLANHCKKVITLDAWENVEPDILLDVTKEPLPFSDNSIDVVLIIDFIEHLERDEGERLLVEVERVARKSIIILTPLWWDENKRHVKNPDLWCFQNQFNLHKSLWAIEDFADWERWPIKGSVTNYFIGIKRI